MADTQRRQGEGATVTCRHIPFQARAQLAHDAKVKALVEKIKAEQAAGIETPTLPLGPSPPDLAMEKAQFEV